jgi:RNA polymerase sigma-70 factor (ECF subfamily)
VPAESSTQLSERELISRVLSGERERFHELLRPYERAMFITALSILRNQADAEEAVQEAVLKAMTHLGQLSDYAKLKGWLLRIATNEARLKRRSRHEKLFESLEELQQEDKDHEFMPHDFADLREIPSETLERKEVRQAVATALHKLPEIYREIFILRDVEDLNISECCEVLGISEQAVKVRLHRARLRIREELAPVFKANWFSRALSFKRKKIW